jgi:Na+-translocating ferredoxin:NAD+ oxidoreductase RnfD subunit
VLRVGDRHLWNPTNFGLTLILFLAADSVASLTVQAGNEAWAAIVIWVLGGMILWQFRLLHISLAFLAAFIPLSLFRSWWTGHGVVTELAPVTSPMFQLFLFFMITDPKTITKRRWSQVLVAVLIAVMETVYRLAFRDIYSLFHSLFTVGPIANLIEIAYLAYLAPKKAPAAPVPAQPGAAPEVAVAKA